MSQLTIPQSEAFIAYDLPAVGPGQNLAINFPFFALSDIDVSFIDAVNGIVTVLVYGPNYTVSGVAADDGYSSGNVNIIPAFPAGKFVVARDTPVEKLQNWPTTGAFSIYAENTLWSKHTAWHQQHFRDTKRSIRAPMGESILEMPARIIRANKLMQFDAQGDPKASAVNADDLVSQAEAAAAAAAASAAAADVSEANAAASASSAQGSATSAAGSAAAANTSALNAAASATAASTSASNAASSATAASGSAGAASGFATNAASSAAAAAASAASVGQPATETVMGIAEIATQSETDAGAIDNRIITPLKMVQYLLTHMTPGGGLISNASELVSGILMLASQAETNAGVDDTKAITPAKLHGFNGWMVGPVGIGGAPGAARRLEVHGPVNTTVYSGIKSSGATGYSIQVLETTSRVWGLEGTGVDFKIADYTAGAARLQISSSGHVGIGGAPASILHVQTTNPEMILEGAAGGYVTFRMKGNRNWILQHPPTGELSIYDMTVGVARLTINSSGEVGIGGAPLAGMNLALIAAGAGHVNHTLKTDSRQWNLAAIGSSIPAYAGQFWIYDATAGATRLTINSSGQVGIGTAPATKLHVYDAAYAELRIETGGSNQAALYLKNTARNWGFLADTDGALRFYDASAGAMRMTINSVGNVGIGDDTTPSADPGQPLRLHRNGYCVPRIESGGSGGATAGLFMSTFGLRSWQIYINSSGGLEFYDASVPANRMRIDIAGSIQMGTFGTGGTAGKQLTQGTDTNSSAPTTAVTGHYHFYNPNGLAGHIQTSGPTTLFNTSSDLRLKEADEPFDAGLILDALSARKFRWKAGGTGYGVFAQEAADVFPDAVSPPLNEGDPWMVDYSKFVPLLLCETKALRARVALLEGVPK